MSKILRTPSLPAILLCAITIVPYWQVFGFEFIVYDDYSYVTNNPVVRDGLSLRGLSWAFTTFHASNWHPLTWISHMVDVELFGLNAGWHHLVNLLFHITNTLLIYRVLREMTGATWRSFLVAVLFGVHPLHVESVAWVAERKDVLSAFFWILTMAAYIRYVRRPGTGRYLSVLAFFILGLMSKPMVVSLPFVLLLLDWWPLGRMTAGNEPSGSLRSFLRDSLPRLALEKLPLALLSSLSCAVTYLAQKAGETVNVTVSFWDRIQNALLAYVTYIWKTLYPVSLTVLYPHPGSSIQTDGAIAAGVLVAAATAASIRFADRHPHILVGWFWYLGTLIPVIGLVQVGVQSLADRYTYIPLLGLFMAVCWEMNVFQERLRLRRIHLAIPVALGLSVLVVATGIQVRYWKNSVTLFRHALELTSNNWVGHLDLGWALEQEGRFDEAVFHYRESIRINPRNPYGHNNLGYVLELQGRTDEAIQHYLEALRLKPDYLYARRNLERINSRGKGS